MKPYYISKLERRRLIAAISYWEKHSKPEAKTYWQYLRSKLLEITGPSE